MENYTNSKIKCENISKVNASFMRNDLVVLGYPYRLRIEISNICNLKCTFSKDVFGVCSQWEINKTSVLMSLDFLKKIIDEVGAYLTHAELYNYGEPFMNPYATDMIRYFKKINSDVIIEIHTNGHYFETEEKRLDVINSGLDVLSFSVDGITQKVYEKYRIGGDLSKVVEAIREICRLKKMMKGEKPKIIFQFIIFEHNIHEAIYVNRFAKDLGVDEVVIKTDLFSMKPELKMLYGDIYNSILPIQSKDSIDSFSKKDVEAGHSFCDFPWTYPTILTDGRVVVCCRDRYYRSIVGTIRDKTLLQLWNGEGYQEFRKKFLEDEVKPYPCCLCECRPKIMQ